MLVGNRGHLQPVQRRALAAVAILDVSERQLPGDGELRHALWREIFIYRTVVGALRAAVHNVLDMHR